MDSRPSILVVDDEQRSLESIERILGDSFDVFTAINTEEAEKILQQQWIQVLLCAQRMPGMTGTELAGRLVSRRPDIKVLLMSGYTDEALEGRGGTWGPDGDILFTPDTQSPIHRVSASGGEPTPVTTDQGGRRTWP